MSDLNREKILKEKGYVETRGPNGTRRIFTPEEYEEFMKELDAYPDKHKADQLRRMLNPVYHEPEKG
jgi:hypothetical protein